MGEFRAETFCLTVTPGGASPSPTRKERRRDQEASVALRWVAEV